MPVLDANEALRGQWNSLLNIMKAEAVDGGRLAGVQYIGKAAQLWTRKPPAIGVQFLRAPFKSYATNQRLMTSTFLIVIGVQSTDASASTNMGPNTPPNLEDANVILEPYTLGTDDNPKNGILSVLTDPANFTLGGYSMNSTPGEISYEWEIAPGKPPQIWAYGMMQLVAQAVVNL